MTRCLRTRGMVAATLLAVGLCPSMLWAGQRDGLPVRRTGNLLIITAPDFDHSAALTQFIAGKEAQGLNVQVYVPAAGTSNDDIRAYIVDQWNYAFKPNFVLLVGDTSGQNSSASTIPHFIGGGSKGAATDLFYGCMGAGDDWYPEFPVGRFSVVSNGQLQAIVDKTLFVEAGVFSSDEYVTTAAFLANPSTQGMAEPSHDYVIENYLDPNDYTGLKLYAAQGAGTQDVTDAINAGTLFAVYYGHSSSSGWWDPSFGTSNVRSLCNAGLYPVAMGWSCNTAHYTYDECVGEVWIREANKGAVAYISASDYIYWGSVDAWMPSTMHERSFFQAVFEDEIWELGPAWRQGCYHFLTNYGEWDGNPNHAPAAHVDECRNFVEEFVLLGDPSLLLPRPNGFTLSGAPDAQSVCIPGQDEVSYQIDVDLLGSFDETVRLTVSGAPQQASASFDINDAYPPYSSQLTIDNLMWATPGNYTLTVEAVSATQQRALALELTVSSAIPAVVSLVAPADGAEDVARAPLLEWTPQGGAYEYDVQIALDSGFAQVVYDATVTEATHQAAVNLQTDTLYYWRVRGVSGCGVGDWCAPFSFRTLIQPDYFTEQFGTGNGFDLEYLTATFYPDGSGDHYGVCVEPAAAFPTDPTGGTQINLSEDAYQEIGVGGLAEVDFYGVRYDSFWICDNGYITFTGGDNDYTESLQDHFDMPRLSALFNDLSCPAGGVVSYRQVDDRVAVSFDGVPEWNSSNNNTFQVEMFFDGRIRVTWLQVDSSTAVVGLSAGDGLPGDFVLSDLSASPACPLDPADINGDGTVDLNDAAMFAECLSGPDVTLPPPGVQPEDFDRADADDDGDVDEVDLAAFQIAFGAALD
jgi:hypothetical protein